MAGKHSIIKRINAITVGVIDNNFKRYSLVIRSALVIKPILKDPFYQDLKDSLMNRINLDYIKHSDSIYNMVLPLSRAINNLVTFVKIQHIFCMIFQ